MAREVPVVAALSAVVTLCTGVAGIASMSLRQQITPSRLLGRVTAAFWTLHSALGPIGAAVLTRGASEAGVTTTLAVAGFVCAAVALAGTATSVGRARKGWRARVADDVAEEAPA
jgi:hypothetical protein